MNKPKISILVPTYNRPQLLERTLNSILSQSYEGIIETIVVNDAGKDIQKVIKKTNLHKIRPIKYFQNKENRGLAGTRNVAIQKATGDYICLLDDDDIFLPYALEFRMYMMDKLNTEIVYTRALQDIWEKTSGGYKSIHKQLYWDSPFDRDLILIQNIAPCCCPLFSRKAWDESGNYLFDENLDTSEDFDFWVALSRKTNFEELKLIDCECSYRKEKDGQMTGNKNFGKAYPVIYNRWRNTAENLEWVKAHQNNMLLKMGMKPENFGL